MRLGNPELSIIRRMEVTVGMLLLLTRSLRTLLSTPLSTTPGRSSLHPYRLADNKQQTTLMDIPCVIYCNS
jgi:hypothetical protein